MKYEKYNVELFLEISLESKYFGFIYHLLGLVDKLDLGILSDIEMILVLEESKRLLKSVDVFID